MTFYEITQMYVVPRTGLARIMRRHNLPTDLTSSRSARHIQELLFRINQFIWPMRNFREWHHKKIRHRIAIRH
jgi:hypothetical protein